MSQKTPLERPELNSEVPSIPASIESPRTKLIWVTIETAGAVSVSELCQAIDVPLLTLYPHLNALEDQGHLKWTDETLQTAGEPPRPNH